MTTDPPTAPAEGPGLEHRLARRADRYGLTVLIGAGVLLVAIGTGLVTGPLATLALTLVLGIILALIGVAIVGGPEARRLLAPYGLLKPGTLWLALFYLAPPVDALADLAVVQGEPI